MGDAEFTIEAGWQLQTDVSVRDMRWGDPDQECYADILRDEGRLRRITGVQTTAEAMRIGEALQAGDRLTVECGRMRLTGWFQVEHDDAGYVLKGTVERTEYV